MSTYVNISQLSKMLNLINPETKKPLNHVLRYWEKEFKSIRPKKINNRRYYSSKQVEIIKLIKFLLKNKGMSIHGAKKIINSCGKKLDVHNLNSLEANINKEVIRLKIMAKKTHIKVRMVPESNPDSKFIYYAKKPTKGEKAKDKLKLKKYNPNTRKHEFFVEKKLPPHSK